MEKIRSIQDIVEEQCLKWEKDYHAIRAEMAKVGPTITISREPGSGGLKIARRLVENSNLDLYAGNILDRIAKKSNLGRVVINTLDEQPPSFWDDIFAYIDEKFAMSSDDYFNHLVKIIGAVSKVGNAVILGRGANFIIPDDRCFKVRLVAPFEVRINRYMNAHGLSHESSVKKLEEIEKERRNYVKSYFGADISSASHYHIVLNTATIPIDTCIQIIQRLALPH